MFTYNILILWSFGRTFQLCEKCGNGSYNVVFFETLFVAKAMNGIKNKCYSSCFISQNGEICSTLKKKTPSKLFNV